MERSVFVIGRPTTVEPPDWLEEARGDQLRGLRTDRLVEMAGRVCYDSFGKGRSSEDFHKHLRESGHVNPTYHAVYVFRIQGYSRSMTKELFRHHVGCSPSERSGRYVDESETPWTTHPLLEAYCADTDPDADEEGIYNLEEDLKEYIEQGRSLYRRTVSRLEPWLVSKGLSAGDARKQARAAARQYLGNGLETEFVWSANIEAIRNVIRQRGVPAADAEIRDFAVKLARVMEDECPTYFSDLDFYSKYDGLTTCVRFGGDDD